MKNKKWFYPLMIAIACLALLFLAGCGGYLLLHQLGESRRSEALLRRADKISDEYDRLLNNDKAEKSVTADAANVSAPASSASDPIRILDDTQALTEAAGDKLHMLITDDTEAQSEVMEQLPEHQIIFVGDSRTNGMAKAMAHYDDDCIYIGKDGEGLRWFSDEGMDQMSGAIRDYPDAPVVLNLGVNDTSEYTHYVELYSTFAEIWPDTDFYFMSVNPVADKIEFELTVDNDVINTFNENVKDIFPGHYIDTNTQMKENNFETVDGVHYPWKEYRAIHNFVVDTIFQ